MKLKYFIVLKLLVFSTISLSQTSLTYNNCEFTNNMQTSCSSTYIHYARDFYLSDFNVPTNNNFLITDINFAITYAEWGANYQVNVYLIDNNFPNNFDIFTATPIGSSNTYQQLPYVGFRTMPPVEINYIFPLPVIIPSGQERVLVTIVKGDTSGSGLIHFAGTSIDTGNDWFFGCHRSPVPNYTIFQNVNVIQNANYPGVDWNIYMKVNGSLQDTTTAYTINYNSDCGLEKMFTLNNVSNIQSVIWNFDNISSGANNTSGLLNPTHLFTSTGSYDVTASITSTTGVVTNITKTLQVIDAPSYNVVPSLLGCANALNSGFSDSFDTSNLNNLINGGQLNTTISYYRQNGELLPMPLPNFLSNTVANSETITARIAYTSDLCCYSETTFDLIVVNKPTLPSLPNLINCATTNSGFSQFDFSNINSVVLATNSQFEIEYRTSNGNLISSSNWGSYININPTSDYVTIKVTDPITRCFDEKDILLNVQESPTIPILSSLTSCDDDGDGISTDFDLSNVENEILNNRNGLAIRYYDSNYNDITSSFITPFTNSTPFTEIIRVELINPATGCSSFGDLILNTLNKPLISQPNALFSCDRGNGFSIFDLSQLENDITSGQSNVTLQFYDSGSNQILGSQITNYTNATPYLENITATVFFNSNPRCLSTVNFDIKVKELPEVLIEEHYTICGSLPSLNLMVANNMDSYVWTYLNNNQIISNTNTASLVDEGNYSLAIFEESDNTVCSNLYFFNMTRSNLPTITDILINNFGNNSLEVIANGSGILEYSIDGTNYQNSNLFLNLSGGSYTVYARDKEGCGEDSQEANILDFPRYFTPNNDGYHDYWQISGITADTEAQIFIYDRFGKLLKTIEANDNGWDGNYNSNPLPSSTYWFEIVFSNGNKFKGYFALKR